MNDGPVVGGSRDEPGHWPAPSPAASSSADPWVHRTLDEIQAQLDRLWSSADNPSGEPTPGQAAVPYLFVTDDGSVYERTHPDEFDEWDGDDE